MIDTPGYTKKCKEELKKPPTVEGPPKRDKCPQPCTCPAPPGGPPSGCIETLIRNQAQIVAEAERAKAFVDELTAFQGKLALALTEYTQARYKDLTKLWVAQDKLIADLTEKLKCTVPCWECLLECRLCPLIEEIRGLEDWLDGTGDLAAKVYSLYDLECWRRRNVAQQQARVDRISAVLAAWEKPSSTLGDALDKNGKLVADLPTVLASDPAKAIYDIFMTLVPRHWAIRPRGTNAPTTLIKEKFIKICACDNGTPDDCCGPDVGVVRSLRDRLVGTLPYIVDPAEFTGIVCCLVVERLQPASQFLATAQAELAATSAEIEQTKKLIESGTAAIESAFKAELDNPIDCGQYRRNDPPPPPATPTPPPAPAPETQDDGHGTLRAGPAT